MLPAMALAFCLGAVDVPPRAEPPAPQQTQSDDDKKIVHATFFGEGGGYQDPSRDAKEYLEKTPPPEPVGKPPAAEYKKTRDAFIPRDPASRRYQHDAPEA